LRLHVLANPHGITDLRYRMEPFNIAVSKFITNMVPLGWQITHYGHELSQVACENVAVISATELPPQDESTLFPHNPALTQLFAHRVNQQLQTTAQPGDAVLCFYGSDHSDAVQNLSDVLIVEPSIGYRAEAVFAPYRVFTSYAQMHYYYGKNNQLHTPSWTDAVIPNAFTPNEFKYSDNKGDYLLYLGRVSGEKGIDIAIKTAAATGRRLIIAGPGHIDSVPAGVEMIGYVNVEQRQTLLAGAAALIAPTYYIEPFGNIVIEAAMSGTPVLTTDWGGFTETVVQGRTGFRCRSLEEFVQAVDKLPEIYSWACRDWAIEHYSDQVIHDQFDQYFKRIAR
jgi:glycosyltransferase involved in cell wall biosynthesis